MDPQIVSVGIGRLPGGHGFRVLRHRPPGLRSLWQLDGQRLAAGVRGVAVELHDIAGPIRPLLELPVSSLSPSSSLVTRAEQGQQRPLCAGLQVQNWDCDLRRGVLGAGRMEVGSLGMLIGRGDETLIVSNNHVLAGQNRGQIGDRVAQPGGASLATDGVIAHLERFVELRPSPLGATPARANVVWNRVDAAVARLAAGVGWQPGYLPHYQLPQLRRLANPVIGEEVFKVGRTTGLRRGRIVSVGDRLGPIGYSLGACWFEGSFTIEGLGGRAFSEGGDSGAVVVRSDGEVVGLIYAGNGVETFACPITEVLRALEL
ncbi:hypothetical protein ENSA5_07010 [Enhygromyxa salina]|uniref:Uncharacterized protein n=1 Tax=Enhygromyxa salina TaxID=215803 RepID=A0A2S9YH91_9BACT|nr:trypsin-like peptidase domain-containing protein [Enhygromyxa salina]PRQ04470.1 hypothetical protein ENSA5_07010 [Enhygromyxa salina]